MTAFPALLLAVLLDACWGEPRRWHPLVGFGRLAGALEKKLNKGTRGIFRGWLAWCLLLAPLLVGAMLLQSICNALWAPLGIALEALLVYFAIGLKSLGDHARAVALALHAEDLPRARHALSLIVSRDTRALDSGAISRAAIESVLENGSDAVIATLFWFALAGIPGAVVHRAANTLDAMWGYRNRRFNEFGRIAARADDVLNFIPARISALLYALLGNTDTALRCWREQARAWSSPNAGPAMAAGAGALNVVLGGNAVYAGENERRPLLGCGRAPQADDIARAVRMVLRSAIAFCVGVALLEWVW